MPSQDTRHLIDPEILPVLDLMSMGDVTSDNLAEFRAAGLARFASAPPPALAPSTEYAPSVDGSPDVGLLVYNPLRTSAGLRGAVVHIHGGGMIMGSVQMSTMSCPPIALSNDALVVSVDYRLAPETPFPGPQEDCYAALRWVVANAARFDVDPTRIVITGESAGGGLAASLGLMARDRGEFHVAGQILTYPMLDHRVGGPDDPYKNPVTGEFVWTPVRNQFGWTALRGDYALDDDRIGWYSPSRAASLAGLPPTVILTGSLDLFLDEDLDYTQRLCGAGVPTELHVYAGAIHAFQVLPGTRLANQYAKDFLSAFTRLLAA